MPADASRGQLLYVKESTFGTTPSTPVMKIMRITGESLKMDTPTTISQEIEATGQISDVIRTSLMSSGDVNGELSLTTWDDWIQFALRSSGWSSPVTVAAATISASEVDNSFNDSGSGFGSLQVGQWILAAGFSNAENNGLFKIATKPSSGKITVVNPANGLGGLVNESAAAGRSITMGAQVVNGTTLSPMTIERQYLDVASDFVVFTGQVINTMTINVAKEALLTMAFSMMGRNERSYTQSRATALSGSQSAATTTDVLNAVDDVTAVLWGDYGNVTALDVTSINLTVNNNLRARTQVAYEGPKSMGSGQINVQGTLQTYYESNVLAETYINRNDTSLALVFKKGANQLVIEIPRCKFTTSTRPLGGINTDVMNDISFQALKKSGTGENVTIRIAKF
jgi:hypothetical protein